MSSASTLPLLPGQIVMALILAALLAYPLSRLILYRYAKAVERAMRTRSEAGATPLAPTARPTAPPAVPSLLHALRQQPWRNALVQLIAAGVTGLWFAFLTLHAGQISVSPYRIAGLAATHLWPGVLGVLFVAGISRRQRSWILILGALAYIALIIAFETQPWPLALGDALKLWLSSNLPPTLLLCAFLSARVRSIGPLILLTCLLSVGGAIAVMAFVANTHTGLTIIGWLMQIGLHTSVSLITATALIGASLALLAGLALVRLLATAYANYRIGEQGMMLASMWLTFILAASINLIFDGTQYFVLGLLAFPLYLLVVRVLRPLLLTGSSAPAPALLLLRVFARKGEVPALFRAVSRHWRHVGPIRMIAGYDLATETIEPDELMAFLRGRLSSGFVTDANVISGRLAMAPRRDADRRFRAEEFFCFDNTWRYTLQALVNTSTVILMDLRQFNERRRGCIFELAELAQTGAMTRCILIYDPANTDMACLQRETAAHGIDADKLPLLRLDGSESANLRRLLTALSGVAAGKPLAHSPA